MSNEPRHGQWVAIAHTDQSQVLVPHGRAWRPVRLGDLPHAQAALLGAQSHERKLVGIYQRANVDARGQSIPAHVVPVAKGSGVNLRFLEGGQALLICFAPASVEIAPVCDRAALPSARLPADPKWQPRA